MARMVLVTDGGQMRNERRAEEGVAESKDWGVFNRERFHIIEHHVTTARNPWMITNHDKQVTHTIQESNPWSFR